MKRMGLVLGSAVLVVTLAACDDDDDTGNGNGNGADAAASSSSGAPTGSSGGSSGTPSGSSSGGSTSSGDAGDPIDAASDAPAGPCTQGQTRCSDQDHVSLETCDANGAWQPTAACPWVCLGGTCAGECGPGSTRGCETTASGQKGCGNQHTEACVGGSSCADPMHVTVETCGTNGEWGASSECPPCFTGTDTTTAGYGSCVLGGLPPQIRCLVASQGACQCPQ